MKLRTLGSAVTAIGLAALGITQAGSASASSNGNYWISAHTYTEVTWSPVAYDECLDDSNTGPNGSDNLRAFTCNSQSYQDWTVVNLANGWAQLENGATHRCLDYSLSSGLRTFPCYQNSFNGGWQKWLLVNRTTASGGAEQVLQSAINQSNGTSTCIDLSASYGLVGFPCSGARQDYGYQGWTNVDNTP